MKNKTLTQIGRIRPVLLSTIIILAGVLMDRTWLWQVGLAVLVLIFVDALYRYRRLG